MALPPTPAAWVARATALRLTPDESLLFEVMTNHHNFTEDQYLNLRDQGGYGTLEDLNQWAYKDIRQWCTNTSALPVTRGGRTFGDLKVRQLQAIAWTVS